MGIDIRDRIREGWVPLPMMATPMGEDMLIMCVTRSMINDNDNKSSNDREERNYIGVIGGKLEVKGSIDAINIFCYRK